MGLKAKDKEFITAELIARGEDVDNKGYFALRKALSNFTDADGNIDMLSGSGISARAVTSESKNPESSSEPVQEQVEEAQVGAEQQDEREEDTGVNDENSAKKDAAEIVEEGSGSEETPVDDNANVKGTDKPETPEAGEEEANEGDQSSAQDTAAEENNSTDKSGEKADDGDHADGTADEGEDELSKFLVSIKMTKFEKEIRAHGAESIEDLSHFEQSDLDDIGMKPLQKRKFMKRVSKALGKISDKANL